MDAKAIAGARHSSPFLIWLDKAPEIISTSKEWADMMGEAAKQADIMMEGLPGLVKLFESARESFVLSLGDEGLTDYLKSFYTGVRKVFIYLENSSSVVKRFTTNLLTIGPALLLLGGVFSIFQFTFSRGKLGYIIAGFGMLSIILSSIGQTLGFSSNAVIGFNAALVARLISLYVYMNRIKTIGKIIDFIKPLKGVLFGIKERGLLRGIFSPRLLCFGVFAGLLFLVGQLIFNFEGLSNSVKKYFTLIQDQGPLVQFLAVLADFLTIGFVAKNIKGLVLSFKSLSSIASIRLFGRLSASLFKFLGLGSLFKATWAFSPF